MPEISDAGVIGIPDERSGEVSRAYVIRSDPRVNAGEVGEWVKGRLAPYKQLGRRVKFVEELPKSPAGKLLRRVLKEKND